MSLSEHVQGISHYTSCDNFVNKHLLFSSVYISLIVSEGYKKSPHRNSKQGLSQLYTKSPCPAPSCQLSAHRTGQGSPIRTRVSVNFYKIVT